MQLHAPFPTGNASGRNYEIARNPVRGLQAPLEIERNIDFR